MVKKLPHGEFVKERVYRIIIRYSNGNESSGSGFFVNKKKFVTCFHVVFGGELRNIRSLPEFNTIQHINEHERLNIFYKNKIPSVFIELDDGSRVTAELNDFSEFYDLVTLKVSVEKKSVNVCKLNIKSIPKYGDSVSFGGFPSQF